MSQRIVDYLEPVEVDEQQGELPLVARGGIDRAAKHAVEHFPVRQIGQAVVRRQILDPLVGLGLFVGAVEILQCKRHVVDEPLQQFGKSGVKVSFSIDMKDITPTICPCTHRGNEAPEFVPSLRAVP